MGSLWKRSSLRSPPRSQSEEQLTFSMQGIIVVVAPRYHFAAAAAAALFRYKNQLRAIFSYYGASNGQPPFKSEQLLEMGLKQWMTFCQEAGILDGGQQGCMVKDLHVS